MRCSRGQSGALSSALAVPGELELWVCRWVRVIRERARALEEEVEEDGNVEEGAEWIEIG
eukprot:3932521-Rhodomonas_salina.2